MSLRIRCVVVVIVDDTIVRWLMRAKIFFSLRDGYLTLRARRLEDLRRLQFVPRKVFAGDFPKTFVDDYVHWLDLDTGEVEFRPVESPWTPDPSNWRLAVATDGTRSVFRKISGDSAVAVDLIDIRSGTFQIISGLLSPLESQEHIIVTLHKSRTRGSPLSIASYILRQFKTQNLNVETCLATSSINFSLVAPCLDSEIELVLCPCDAVTSEMPRRVVIPQGDVEFSSDGEFVNVSINTGTARHVHWHEYTIDTDLGRLTGNVSLHSKLYQCYLHALTSHCLPIRYWDTLGLKSLYKCCKAPPFCHSKDWTTTMRYS
jgi:hypothetical protein